MTNSPLRSATRYAGMLLGVDRVWYPFAAVQLAAAFAEAAELPLRLFHVARKGEDTVEIEQQARLANLDIDIVRAGGLAKDRADAILSHAATENLLPVITTNSRRALGPSIVGSTARELITNSTQPLLLYGPNRSEQSHRPPRVLCSVDGSDFSETVVAEAAAWALHLRVPLWLVQAADANVAASDVAFESGYLHNVAHSLQGDFGEVEWEILHGRHPGKSIADYANQEPGTLTIIATHARQGLDRLIHGSVAADVVRSSSGPVLIHHPDQLLP